MNIRVDASGTPLEVMGFMLKRIRTWSELNRDICVDVFRMWFGAALFLKGIAVSRHAHDFATQLSSLGVPFAGERLVNLASLAHLVGGTLLVFGVFTRLAALIQIPNVIGALIFIHAREGLIFSKDQGFELAMISLLLLVGFCLIGPGRLSTDWYFSEHSQRNIDGERLELLHARLDAEEVSYAAFDRTFNVDDFADERTTDSRPPPPDNTPPKKSAESANL